MSRSKGFSLIEVVIVIVILALVGLIGWRVWMANQDNSTTTDITQPTESEVPEVNSDADLDKADEVLDETNVEGSESEQINSETSF